MNQKREIRTVSLIGLGAIGCFLASHLGPLMGDNLRVIAGGSRRERLEQEGVMVNGVRHHFNIVSPEETCGQDYPDLAIIITKFPALSQALEDMRNQIGPDTLIMAPLNGVEAEEKVAAVFGWDNLLYSLAKVSVVMKDGCASFNPKAARIEMGEKHNETVSPRVQAVKELFERSGIRTVVPEDMERAIEIIRKSKQPFIFVGGGAVLSNAAEELRAFAHKIQAPVADSLMGKGAFDGCDELYTGMVGMHGTKTSNFGITEADLLIVVGARFSDRVTGNASKFARNAKILQLDIDPAEINKNIKVDASIIGDVKVILRKLNARLDPINHDEWIAHIERMKDMYPLRYDKRLLTGPYIIQTIDELTPDDAIIVTEVGQHQMWAAQYYNFRKPRTFITSGGLGTMGFGLGASIGTKIGNPDRVVVNIAGDGCFRMNMNEIATAARYKVHIIEVIINNHVLGMVRQWQTLFYGKRYSQTVLNDNVDYVKLSEAMGAAAYRVTQKEEFAKIFQEAMEKEGPVVIDCQIGCDDKVFPMVSPGAPIADAFDDTDLKIQ